MSSRFSREAGPAGHVSCSQKAFIVGIGSQGNADKERPQSASTSWRARDPGGVRSESKGPRTRSADAPEQDRLRVLLRRREPSHASSTAPFPQAQGTGCRPPVEGNQLFLGPPSSNAHLFQGHPRRHTQKRVRLTVRAPSAQPSRHEAAPQHPTPDLAFRRVPPPSAFPPPLSLGVGGTSSRCPQPVLFPSGSSLGTGTQEPKDSPHMCCPAELIELTSA